MNAFLTNESNWGKRIGGEMLASDCDFKSKLKTFLFRDLELLTIRIAFDVRIVRMVNNYF